MNQIEIHDGALVFVGSGDPQFDTFPQIQTGGSGPVWRLARSFTARGQDVVIYAGTYGPKDVRMVDGIKIIRIPVPPISTFTKKYLPFIDYLSNDLLSQNPGKAIERLFARLVFSYRVSKDINGHAVEGLFLRSRFTGLFPSRLDVPTVFTIKSPDACDFFYKKSVSLHPANRLLFKYKQLIEEFVVSQSDRIIVMNDFMADYFHQKGYKNVEVVMLGVDDEDIISETDAAREKRILYVGRFDGNKRPEWVIRAVDNPRFEDYELRYIGSGPREKTLRKEVREHGLLDRVTFTGRIPRREVLEEMQKAEVLVLPSEFENCPNVVIEAMASGCPVVASDTHGSKQLINDMETGLLFDKNGENSLKEKLSTIVSDQDLASDIRNNALQYIRESHRAEHIANQYLSTLVRAKNSRSGSIQ